MPPPTQTTSKTSRLSGEDLRDYFQTFTERFLQDRATFHFGMVIKSVKRITRATEDAPAIWHVDVVDEKGEEGTLVFNKIVLATGVSVLGIFLSS